MKNFITPVLIAGLIHFENWDDRSGNYKTEYQKWSKHLSEEQIIEEYELILLHKSKLEPSKRAKIKSLYNKIYLKQKGIK